FADNGARNVPDIVLIETKHCAKAGLGQRLSRSGEPVAMEALEIHALFEVDLSRSGRLERTVPAVRRLEIVLADWQEFGPVDLFHWSNSSGLRIASARSFRKTAA